MTAAPGAVQEHDAVIIAGSAYRTGYGNASGVQAHLRNAWHFPVEAICGTCSGVVRRPSKNDPWTHTGRRAGQIPAAGPREEAAMTDDDTAPFPADQFQYLVLADRLEARIRRGEFSATGQLPTARELMRHYDVGSGTVRHAWTELKGRGLVYTRQGFGMFTT